jgi:signal transduction histidine kinase
MIQSIRGRIAALSLACLLALVALVGGLVLRGLASALEELADRDLRAELEQLVGEASDERLTALLAAERRAEVAWGDLAFELRDALDARAARSREEELLYEIRRGGSLVAASAGLAGSPLPRSGAAVERGGIAFREAGDPRPGAAAPLRVAEVPLGPYELRLAKSLAPLRRIETAVRGQVLAVLALVALLGAAGSWLVAARGLAPVRQLAREAERLRTLAQGTLPRSGRGDEIDELAAVLNRLLDRVRREMERQRQFTADVAHEVRTPLAAIRGHLELLLAGSPPGAQHTLATVLDELDRLARLVSRLLLLEKLEQGAEIARRERVDLLALAQGLADHLRVVAEEQGIALETRGREAPVDADPEQLRQVLLNLLDNAFRHTPRGGRVWLEVEPAGDRVRAAVGDSGPGIPPEERERVFDRFRSDRSLPRAGSGLGLPIARAIARAHGGDLRAEPCEAGARFVLDLPAAPR